MNNKQTKKATVDAINVMISHADKGPSGFWVEDHEGCGNPAVFPCLLYTSPSPRDVEESRMPSSA